MNVLVVGGGGREHAIVWKLSRSDRVNKIICAPGNAGIGKLADCRGVSDTDIKGLLDLAKKENIDITIAGPEAPLAMGIVNEFEKEGLKIFGPGQEAALLESSKVFAKELMYKYNIPTAKYKVFSDYEKAVEYIKENGTPCVIKADGLAAGKGVIVAEDETTALSAVDDIMNKRVFGDAGNKVIIEDCIEGEEASILAVTDGENVLPMLPAQDHKRAYDGDRGPNTGGMGAYCPAPVCSSEIQKQVLEEILKPTIQGMKAEGRPYKGILYAGLMITGEGPQVLEYNVRFGDPEAQPLLYMLETDLAGILEAGINKKLGNIELQWKKGASVSVVVASGGYPGKYQKGYPITGLDEAPGGVEVFHAGTAEKDGQIVTSGGRVLNVTAMGKDLPDAMQKAYKAIEHINFEGMHYRTDIGKKALK